MASLTAVEVCESCAGEVDDDELAPVWPADAADAEAPQLWCAACRDRYAHEPAEDDETV
ncbi:MAG: hypothetical protein ACRD12_00315 [Acidimicrobiales bacterium]